jgi:starch phosphorylase
VEAYHGEAENGGIKNPSVSVLNASARNGDGSYLYQGSVPASESGAYGFSVRVVPIHPNLMQAHELRLIAWS